MHHISKSAIVPFTPQQMYELVNNINDYPQFLNWCEGASILNQSDDQITASVQINKGGLKQNFSTLNTLKPFRLIEMQLLDALLINFLVNGDSNHWVIMLQKFS
jgi:ribosome-associated toxin RatA of RatAB toxin-antitoxin module